MLKHFNTICDFGVRRAGTEAELQAGRWLAGHFERLGLKTTIEPVVFNRFHPLKWSLEIPGQASFDSAFPMWYSNSTGPEGVEAEICYLKDGGWRAFEEQDAAGKIVVIDVMRMRGLLNANGAAAYGRAEDAGAAGIVFIDCLCENRMSPHTIKLHRDREYGKIPGIGIGAQDGQQLKECLSKGQNRVHFTLDVLLDTFTGENISGVLPGKTPETILVTSPHDTFFQGATDSAAGLACVAALAEHYVSKDQPEKTMRFYSTTGHYAGCLAGIHYLTKDCQDMVQKEILVNVHCGNAVTGQHYDVIDGKLHPTDKESVRALFLSPNPFLSAFAHDGRSLAKLEEGLMPVPTKVMNIGEHMHVQKLGIPAVGVLGSPAYFDTDLDTPDKVSLEMLERIGIFYTTVIDHIQRVPVHLIQYALEPDEAAIDAARSHFMGNTWPSSDLKPGQINVQQDGQTVEVSTPDAGAFCYLWYFGDSQEAVKTTDPSATHVYQAPGKYEIMLLICDKIGNAVMSCT